MLLPHGEPVPLDELIHPRAEPEIAFLIGRADRGPDHGRRGARGDRGRRSPAIEVVDSRYSEPVPAAGLVADNAGAARVVLGARARRPSELVDLVVLGCVFRCRAGSTPRPAAR